MSQQENCKTHPRYAGKRAPKSTKKHPGGCSTCWAIYRELNACVSQEPNDYEPFSVHDEMY